MVRANLAAPFCSELVMAGLLLTRDFVRLTQCLTKRASSTELPEASPGALAKWVISCMRAERSRRMRRSATSASAAVRANCSAVGFCLSPASFAASSSMS